MLSDAPRGAKADAEPSAGVGRPSSEAGAEASALHTAPMQRWSSYVWRRGTVPIWWGAEIKSTVGEAEIFVAAKDPYSGTDAYFERIAAAYLPEADLEPAAAAPTPATAAPADTAPATPGPAAAAAVATGAVAVDVAVTAPELAAAAVGASAAEASSGVGAGASAAQGGGGVPHQGALEGGGETLPQSAPEQSAVTGHPGAVGIASDGSVCDAAAAAASGGAAGGSGAGAGGSACGGGSAAGGVGAAEGEAAEEPLPPPLPPKPAQRSSELAQQLRQARQLQPAQQVGASQRRARLLPVTCVNLLRCSLKAPELLLSEHFHEGVRAAKRDSTAGLEVHVVNFDWHFSLKTLGEACCTPWPQSILCPLAAKWPQACYRPGMAALVRMLSLSKAGLVRTDRALPRGGVSWAFWNHHLTSWSQHPPSRGPRGAPTRGGLNLPFLHSPGLPLLTGACCTRWR